MNSFVRMNTRFIPAYAGNSIRLLSAFMRAAVHPRLRGELVISFRFLLMRSGSSPLTRGTPTYSIDIHLITRFIPAYAGNSLPVKPTSTDGPVHPRLRGELAQNAQVKVKEYGSSPLTRGTHFQLMAIRHLVRFIPAYAGNSVAENAVVVCCTGSSPLTRGTRKTRLFIRVISRFIPAYAGNSLKDGINPSIHTLGI